MPKAIESLDDIAAHFPEGTPEETLWRFVGLWKESKAHPLETSEAVRRAYTGAQLRGSLAEKMLPNRSRDHLPIDARTGMPHRTANLDWNLSQSVEKLEQGKTKLSRELRSELRSIFGPGVPLDKQLETIRDWNRTAIKDPLEGARQLAFLHGAPRTEIEYEEFVARDRQQTQQTQISEQAVNQAAINLYNSGRVPRTGDAQLDFNNCRDVVIDAARNQMALQQHEQREIAVAQQSIETVSPTIRGTLDSPR